MELALLGPVLLNTVSIPRVPLNVLPGRQQVLIKRLKETMHRGASHELCCRWVGAEGGREESQELLGCRVQDPRRGSDPRIRESVPDPNCSHPQAGKSRCREEEKAEVGVAFLGAWETQCLLDRSRVCAQCRISRVQGDPWRSSWRRQPNGRLPTHEAGNQTQLAWLSPSSAEGCIGTPPGGGGWEGAERSPQSATFQGAQEEPTAHKENRF